MFFVSAVLSRPKRVQDVADPHASAAEDPAVLAVPDLLPVAPG